MGCVRQHRRRGRFGGLDAIPEGQGPQILGGFCHGVCQAHGTTFADSGTRCITHVSNSTVRRVTGAAAPDELCCATIINGNAKPEISPARPLISTPTSTITPHISGGGKQGEGRITLQSPRTRKFHARSPMENVRALRSAALHRRARSTPIHRRGIPQRRETDQVVVADRPGPPHASCARDAINEERQEP
ncbi:hypothetical protein NSERUTF1_6345 [Nocardia seriolae]|nr:hypothetical protein NSERUTF1_6345 [Nocardia seriolae]